jgi:GNAT superfamily N-acetyltransferase
MEYELVPFGKEHVDGAVGLFAESYAREREKLPLLPARASDDPDWIADCLMQRLAEPGVVVLRRQNMVGYMTTGFRFSFKGQQAAACPEFAHAAVEEDKSILYQLMYMALAEKWVAEGIHLHILCHLAGDALLKETLFQLGFGAILAERLRGFSPIEGGADVEIVRERDFSRLIELEIEHNGYYRKSPIFILKDTDREFMATDLEEHSRTDEFLVYYEEGEPAACFIMGESSAEEEGFLLRGTNSAQVKSAYVKPHLRGQGIGKAMLRHGVAWAQERGFERLFVEHETANFYGGNFWPRYFSPYLFVSMRYIENRL